MVIFSVLGVQNYGSKDAVSAQQIQVPAFIESVTVYSHKGYVRPCNTLLVWSSVGAVV